MQSVFEEFDEHILNETKRLWIERRLDLMAREAGILEKLPNGVYRSLIYKENR